MSVDGDVAFYYQLYGRLHRLAREKARQFDDEAILSLLLYTENTIAIGLDGVYEYMYRCAGNVVFRWCDGLGMDANATSRVHNLVSQTVADAPHSTLRQWITDSVLSRDFLRLGDMLAWFARKDRVLRRICPDLRYREAMFLRLTEDRQTAYRMLWADMTFNWRDKHGNSLSDTLARQFRLSASSTEEQEKDLLRETAELLSSIRSERLDIYTVIARKDGHTLTLRRRDGRVFRDVTFPIPVPENVQSCHLAAQLVTYTDKTYVNGPIQWLDGERQADWNSDDIWSGILKKEQEAARRVCFTTPFGKRISLYEDLYTVPGDPVEAGYAEQGIYWDEPNIFDFLEQLKPSDAISGTAERYV